MMNEHVSDLELQQYASDRSGCTKEAREHIEACASCRAEAASYQLMFAGIGELPKAAFEFDLAGMVLSQLPAPPQVQSPIEVREMAADSSGTRRFGSSAWAMALLVGGVIGISLYLFRKNICNTFTGISGLFMYLILGAAGIVVASRVLAMYKKYRRTLESLNYY